MLPCKFRRTSTNNLLDQQMYYEQQQSQRTAGPADYRVEELMGNSNITRGDKRAVPKYSFGTTLTHRTLDSHSNKKLQNLKDPNVASLENVSQSPSRYTLAGSGTNRMLFHRIGDNPVPGVGEYSIGTASINMRNKSPKATIGQAERFPKEQSLCRYVPHIPAQYMKEAAKVQAKPPKLGTIGQEKRWSKHQKTPGVGDYNINGFKSLGRASETVFETMQPMSRRSGSRERHSRSRSAMQRPGREQMRSDFSGFQRNNSDTKNFVTFNGNAARSTAGTSRQYNGTSHYTTSNVRHDRSTSNTNTQKRLGGPTVSTTNYMNNVTREQREIRYFRENESALLNRLGPGPAKYQCYNKGASARHTYSIPRVSPYSFTSINLFCLGNSKHRHRRSKSPKTKEKSSQSCTFRFS